MLIGRRIYPISFDLVRTKYQMGIKEGESAMQSGTCGKTSLESE